MPQSVDLRYPIGKFDRRSAVTAEDRGKAIAIIRDTPRMLRDAIAGLSDEQLDARYRPEGWTVRQLIHHMADSHMNAYVRFRLALTEEEPLIKTYEEHLWAELPDARTAPAALSLALLEALHERWVRMLESMKAEDFGRKLRHPEHGPIDLALMLPMYAWHGLHHTAHITRLREQSRW